MLRNVIFTYLQNFVSPYIIDKLSVIIVNILAYGQYWHVVTHAYIYYWQVVTHDHVNILTGCHSCIHTLLTGCHSCIHTSCTLSVFHLAISNMAQRHAAFCERHVALQVRHVALLIFRQWSASLNYCYVIFNPPRPLSQWKTPHRWCFALTPMTQYLITACVHSGNNWRCLHT